MEVCCSHVNVLAALPQPWSSQQGPKVNSPSFTPQSVRQGTAQPVKLGPSIVQNNNNNSNNNNNNVSTITMTSLLSAADPTSGFRGPQAFGAGSSIREEWEAKRKASIQPASDKDPRIRTLSTGVGPFHSLTPLDDATRDTTLTFFGYHSPVYRARHSGDGQLYALRGLKSYRTPRAAMTPMMNCLERWKNIRHPSIVALKEAFVLDGGAGN